MSREVVISGISNTYIQAALMMGKMIIAEIKLINPINPKSFDISIDPNDC